MSVGLLNKLRLRKTNKTEHHTHTHTERERDGELSFPFINQSIITESQVITKAEV